jgi:hypothetical protein
MNSAQNLTPGRMQETSCNWDKERKQWHDWVRLTGAGRWGNINRKIPRRRRRSLLYWRPIRKLPVYRKTTTTKQVELSEHNIGGSGLGVETISLFCFSYHEAVILFDFGSWISEEKEWKDQEKTDNCFARNVVITCPPSRNEFNDLNVCLVKILVIQSPDVNDPLTHVLAQSVPTSTIALMCKNSLDFENFPASLQSS